MAGTGKLLQMPTVPSPGSAVAPPDEAVASALRRLATLACRALAARAAYAHSDRLGEPIRIGRAGSDDPIVASAPTGCADELLQRILRDGETIRCDGPGRAGRLGSVASLGVPLALPHNEHGAVVVLDNAPRSWLEEELALLHELAEAATVELQLRAELAALHSDTHVRESILGSITDAFYILDRDWRIIAANAVASDWFGLPLDTLVGASFWDLCPAPVRPIFEPRYRLVLESGQPLTFEHRSRRTGRWFSIHVYAHTGGLGVFFRDITQQRQAADDLRYQAALLRAQREASPDSILIVSVDREIIDANGRFEELWGMDRASIVCQPFAVAWPELSARLADPDGWLATTRRFYEDPLASGRGILSMRNGRTLEWHTAPVIGDDGSYLGRVWFHSDITERFEAERATREAETRYRRLVEQIPAVTYIAAEDVRQAPLYVSPQLDAVLGFPPQAWLSNPRFIRERIHPEDEERLFQERQQALVSGRFTTEFRLVHRDGQVVWVQDDMVRLPSEQGMPHAWQGILTDISERKRAEATLRLQALTFANLNDAIVIADPDGRVIDWNPAAERVFGYSRDEVVGRDVGFVHGGSAWRAQRRQLADAIRRDGRWYGELVGRRKDGSIIICESQVVALYDEQGQIVASIGVNHDITERKELEDELVHQAFHDPLTGLPNRSLLFEHIGRELDRPASARRAATILFLDLDNFKVVNGSLGHAVGDQLLIAVGERLRDCLRHGDTVARLGGDEFAVLLVSSAEPEAREIAERLVAAIDRPFSIAGHELRVTTSIGVASVTAGARPEDVVREADVALYRAKHLGKARYAVFDENMNAEAMARLELEHDLRRAVEADELRIAYQPIVDLTTGAVRGVEALLRWNHPVRGLVSPQQFIPVTEESGLIFVVGRRMLFEACRQVRRWQEQFPTEPPLELSVNLSARQFHSIDLVDDIQQALAESGLEPHALQLEITENVTVDGMAEALERMRRLKALGIRIAVDDFGTGYSSLAYLKRFPVDLLKIDRSFVADIEHDAEDRALVTAVLATARALSLSVTAEGIETAGQLAELCALGCDLGQGHYFAAAAAAEEIEAFVRSRVTAGISD